MKLSSAKIIDTRGRLFGLINIIDMGVLIILIIFGCVFFKLARNAKFGYPIEIEIKAIFPSISPQILEKLYPGDIGIRHSKGSRLIRFEPVDKTDSGLSNVYVWLKLPVRVKDVPVGNRGEKAASYFRNGIEFNIDDPIIFLTPEYSIRGTIINIGNMDREIEVVLEPSLPEGLLDAIKTGDRVIRMGHIVGEVLAKEYIDGEVRVRLHIKRGEVDLKMGQSFTFETERYYVNANIIRSIPWREN